MKTKPKGYWTKERVFEEARKYKTKKEFQKSCANLYQVARRNRWLSEMTWFVETKKANGYWDIKENVFNEAIKYKTKKEFKKSCGGAYDAARRNAWMPEMTWFVKPVSHNKKWTKEAIFIEARKHRTKWEFCKNASGAYDAARRNGWLSEMTWFQNGYELRHIS